MCTKYYISKVTNKRRIAKKLIDIILNIVLTLNENIIDQIIIPTDKEKKFANQIFATNKEPKK